MDNWLCQSQGSTDLPHFGLSRRNFCGTLIKAYLPSSYDVVTLLIDGRGSAYEGDKFMHSTYKQLGYIEPIDQIAVTRHVLGKY